MMFDALKKIILVVVVTSILLILHVQIKYGDSDSRRTFMRGNEAVDRRPIGRHNGLTVPSLHNRNLSGNNDVKYASDEKDYIVSNYSVSGIGYLSQDNKKRFLWCDRKNTNGYPMHAFNHTCTKMGFKEDTGKKVALASFPGAGSTWSRTLLEQATGVYTGAIYCDRKLKREGFLGEFITSGNVIAIKTHASRATQINYDSAIVLVRSIDDAVRSEINRRASKKNHTGTIDEEEFREQYETIEQFISQLSSRYTKTLNFWLHIDIPTIVVRYEDLVKDTRTQLQRMLDFLKYPYTEERLDCVVNHQIETFHRRHDHKFDPFTDNQKRNFAKIMKHVELLLNMHNTTYSDIIDM